MKAATMHSVRKGIRSLTKKGSDPCHEAIAEDDHDPNNDSLPSIPSLSDSEGEMNDDAPSSKSKERRKLGMVKGLSFKRKRNKEKAVSHIGEIDTDAIRKKLADAKRELEETARKLALVDNDNNSCPDLTGDDDDNKKHKRRSRRSRSVPRLEFDAASGEAVVQLGGKKATRRRSSRSGFRKLKEDDKSSGSNGTSGRSKPERRTSRKTKRRSKLSEALFSSDEGSSPLRRVQTESSLSKKERQSRSGDSTEGAPFRRTKTDPNKLKKEKQPKKTTWIADELEDIPARRSKPERANSSRSLRGALRGSLKKASSARFVRTRSRSSDGGKRRGSSRHERTAVADDNPKKRGSSRHERSTMEERPGLQRASSARGIIRSERASVRGERTTRSRPGVQRASSAKAQLLTSMPARQRLQRAASAKGLGLIGSEQREALQRQKEEEEEDDSIPSIESAAMSRQKRRASRLHRGSIVNTQVAQLQLQQLDSHRRDSEKNKRLSKREKIKKEALKMLEADYKGEDDTADRVGEGKEEPERPRHQRRKSSGTLTLQNLFSAESDLQQAAIAAGDAKSTTGLSIDGPLTKAPKAKKPKKAVVQPPAEPSPFADLDDSILIRDNTMDGYESQSNIRFAVSA